MSRLDEELKIAFQRREPSADFAARVLARLDEAPVALAPPFWQRLAGWFAVPAWRFAAVGAMALMLVALGFLVLRAQRTTRFEPATSAVASTTVAGPVVPDDRAKNLANSIAAQSGPARTVGRPPMPHRAVIVARHAQPSAEAIAAKEKVLFALQITSDTLNEVQRAISDDRPTNEKPEPVQNR